MYVFLLKLGMWKKHFKPTIFHQEIKKSKKEEEETLKNKVLHDYITNYLPLTNLIENTFFDFYDFHLERVISNTSEKRNDVGIIYSNITCIPPQNIDLDHLLSQRKSLLFKIIADIEIKIGKYRILFPEHLICSWPYLVNHRRNSFTNSSQTDFGGYFIIKGTEKMITCHEKLLDNHPIFYDNTAYVRCVCLKTFNSYTLSFFLRDSVIMWNHSLLQKAFPLSSILVHIYRKAKETGGIFSEKDNKKGEVENENEDIEVREYKEIMGWLRGSMDPNLWGLVEDKIGFHKQDQCEIPEFIIHSFFPQVSSPFGKFHLIVLIIHKIISGSIYQQGDDRDQYEFKILETGGMTMTLFFRQAIKFIHKETFDDLVSLSKKLLKMNFQRDDKHVCSSIKIVLKETDILKRYSKDYISDWVLKAFVSGNWTFDKNAKNLAQYKSHLTETLNRRNFYSSLAHLRYFSPPGADNLKHGSHRDVLASQIGFVCPIDTPEGAKCGLVKNLSIGAQVSRCSSQKKLIQFFQSKGVAWTQENFKNMADPEYLYCMVDGDIIGFIPKNLSEKWVLEFVKDPNYLLERMYICWNLNFRLSTFEVRTNGERFCRPVIVKKNRSLLDPTFFQCLKNDSIRFIDTRTQKHSFLNEFGEFLFEDIHPLLHFSVSCCLVPWMNFTPSPRITYECSMIKQSVSLMTGNPKKKGYRRVDIIETNQVPLVQTSFYQYVFLNEYGFGNEVVVAIMSYSGYNQEDAIIVNKGSIDRGLFSSYTLTKFSCAKEDKFSNSLPEELIKEYPNIDPQTGVIRVGSHVKRDDMLIYVEDKTKLLHYKETCVYYTLFSQTVVYYVHTTGSMLYVILKRVNIPQVGDKLSSRYAQKGVIGYVMAEEDVPYTEEGIRPDLIINPHCIPSRMTISQLIEMYLGKDACLKGKKNIDGTPFVSKETEFLKTELITHELGKETMYSGFTGKKLEEKVFVGVCYYQVLKHFTEDKLMARTRGKKKLLTLQPVEGKSRGGGLRIGEMEKDALIAYEAEHLLKERLLTLSDVHICKICKTCGRLFDHRIGEPSCPFCGGTQFLDHIIPYATKVLIHYVNGLGIDFRIFDSKSEGKSKLIK